MTILFHGDQCIDSWSLANKRLAHIYVLLELAWKQDTGGRNKAAGLQTIF